MSPALHRYYEGQSNSDNARQLGVGLSTLGMSLLRERSANNLPLRPKAAKATYKLDIGDRKLDQVAVNVDMSDDLKMYYYGFNAEEIANSRCLTRHSMSHMLSRERIKLGLRPLKTRRSDMTADFDDDRDLIMELRSSGMTISKISEKWEVGIRYAQKRIKSWTPEVNGILIKSDGFKVSDSTLPDEFILTLYGQPVMRVTRL